MCCGLSCHRAARAQPLAWLPGRAFGNVREFALAPIVRGRELGHSKRAVLRRLDRLTSELGLDRERARGWTVGQTLAWGCDSPRHVEVARWLGEAS